MENQTQGSVMERENFGRECAGGLGGGGGTVAICICG